MVGRRRRWNVFDKSSKRQIFRGENKGKKQTKANVIIMIFAKTPNNPNITFNLKNKTKQKTMKEMPQVMKGGEMNEWHDSYDTKKMK